MICFNLIYSHDTLDDIDENMRIVSAENLADAGENKECTVCLERYYHEENVDTNRMVFFIKHEYSNFIKNCDCDCYVHNICLSTWFIDKRSCIICRKRLNLRYEPDRTIAIIGGTETHNIRLFLKYLFIIARIMRVFFITSLYAYLAFIGYIIIKVSIANIK